MRDTVYFLVFDGYADWEAALALCEIRRPGDWRIVTVGFSPRAVTSMGGLRVTPDQTLDRIDLSRAALLVLPGGHLWQRGEGAEAMDAAERVHAAGGTVAAVSSAVLALARHGLLARSRHTGNFTGFVGGYGVSYEGSEKYDPDALALSDGGFITASSLGSVEFAHEVIRTLDLYSGSDREHWYRLFKHAAPPPWYAGEKVVAV
ncbi:DJ-1/PfpI family protein [Dyella sp. BiH032]|uniref:DJ-1/PfpI family protein n=1 Tax=Dyella sp. BiH032 TaxID=3075430 RepID=UPI0028931570|nr:DJ-1/PfpI family protein [Dyella sp. BiH032]WNL46221.1 DJ-1/PfpI family protein [Dyella sp. BiH032]